MRLVVLVNLCSTTLWLKALRNIFSSSANSTEVSRAEPTKLHTEKEQRENRGGQNSKNRGRGHTAKENEA